MQKTKKYLKEIDTKVIKFCKHIILDITWKRREWKKKRKRKKKEEERGDDSRYIERKKKIVVCRRKDYKLPFSSLKKNISCIFEITQYAQVCFGWQHLIDKWTRKEERGLIPIFIFFFWGGGKTG